jgi:hypothetical protein
MTRAHIKKAGVALLALALAAVALWMWASQFHLESRSY